MLYFRETIFFCVIWDHLIYMGLSQLCAIDYLIWYIAFMENNIPSTYFQFQVTT
jgi:hypothetical protein